MWHVLTLISFGSILVNVVTVTVCRFFACCFVAHFHSPVRAVLSTLLPLRSVDPSLVVPFFFCHSALVMSYAFCLFFAWRLCRDIAL